jgi:cupin 2 domain-containing protein
VQNLLDNIPASLPKELVEALVNSANVRIERIVSRGHNSPEGFWYDQPTHEWVLVVQGAARLRFEDGRTLEMKSGDYVNIPARARHRVEWTDDTQPTIWLAIHYL